MSMSLTCLSAYTMLSSDLLTLYTVEYNPYPIFDRISKSEREDIYFTLILLIYLFKINHLYSDH